MAFIPTRRPFWLYHGLGLAAFFAVNLAMLIASPQAITFKILTNFILWPPLFTLAVLGFRWLYQHRPYWRGNITRLIILGIGYGAITGFLIAAIITALLLPFLWQEFTGPDITAISGEKLWGMGLSMTLGTALNAHLFISAWIFIYVFIVENRRTRDMEISNLQLQNSLKEARLSSLTSQLNPHFIFNALNNIRFVIHENPQYADRMLTALSELLRHSLTSNRQEKISLRTELEIIDRYLAIVKLQYEDKLIVEQQIADEARACLIPPMALHLLVENAVKHGFENLRHGGTLMLDISMTADILNISVTNPVNEQLTHPIDSTRNTGTGLENIARRLRLLYGNQARLDVKTENARFTAHLQLPREAAHESHDY